MILLSCYLDNAATTSLSQDMKDFLISALDIFGNPSSVYSEGVNANRMIEDVRGKVSTYINTNMSENIYFTSSGSASNTLGIQGYSLVNKCSILFSPAVHKSILKTVDNLVRFYKMSATELKVDSFGNIDVEYLNQAISKENGNVLVVVEYANSEIGTIQDIKTISDVVHRYGGRLFVDCTGSISTIPLDVTELNIDIATFSAHKIGALKGVGVLYKKSDITMLPLVFGSQEQGLFAGTENVLGILSLGKAIDLINYDKTSRSRDFVWGNIKNTERVSLVGVPLGENRLINNLYICVKGVRGGDLVALMDDLYKIQISTGSACNNGSPIPSYTALAIGLSEEEANSCVRISFSGNETEDELKEFCKSFSTCVKMLRNFND